MKIFEWILRVLTVAVFIWPVGLLAIFAIVFAVFTPFKEIGTIFDGFSLYSILNYLIVFGGALGSIALLRALFSVKNRPTLHFLIAGVLSYLTIFPLNTLSHFPAEVILTCLPPLIAMAYMYLIVVKSVKITTKNIGSESIIKEIVTFSLVYLGIYAICSGLLIGERTGKDRIVDKVSGVRYVKLINS